MTVMKFTTYFLLGGLVLGACAACSQGQKSGGTDAEDPHVVMKAEAGRQGPRRMELSDVTSRFRFQGKPCEAQVFRSPDETLPLVKDEQGNEFVDNRVTLRLTSDGRRLPDRVFTKSSFSSVVDEGFLRHAILEGVVYDTVTAREVVFAASVSYPESDLYVPIRLGISADGHVTMRAEDLLEE